MKGKIEHKFFETKEIDDENGEVLFYATTFDSVDSHGDTVSKEAVHRTVKSFNEGYAIELLKDHSQEDFVGLVKELSVDEVGLLVKGVLNLKTKIGAEVYEDIKFRQKQGFPLKWSIGFITEDFEIKQDGTRILKDIDIKEISAISFKPSNEEAVTVDVKKVFDSKKKETKKTLLNLLN